MKLLLLLPIFVLVAALAACVPKQVNQPWSFQGEIPMTGSMIYTAD